MMMVWGICFLLFFCCIESEVVSSLGKMYLAIRNVVFKSQHALPLVVQFCARRKFYKILSHINFCFGVWRQRRNLYGSTGRKNGSEETSPIRSCHQRPWL